SGTLGKSVRLIKNPSSTRRWILFVSLILCQFQMWVLIRTGRLKMFAPMQKNHCKPSQTGLVVIFSNQTD
ncbi:TPA: hypothetical protein ACKJZF_001893, partial [Neisseria gonorrhoeae]